MRGIKTGLVLLLDWWEPLCFYISHALYAKKSFPLVVSLIWDRLINA